MYANGRVIPPIFFAKKGGWYAKCCYFCSMNQSMAHTPHKQSVRNATKRGKTSPKPSMLLLTATLIATGLTFSAIRFADKLSGLKRVDEIIIHCTATPRDTMVTIDDIEQWHRKRGFTGIGYHYVIYLDGTVHPGRPANHVGAHCLGHNTHSIGVCYVGGLDAEGNPIDTRTQAQKDSLLFLLKTLKEKHPRAKIYGHNCFSEKQCPCFDAEKEYQGL